MIAHAIIRTGAAFILISAGALVSGCSPSDQDYTPTANMGGNQSLQQNPNAMQYGPAPTEMQNSVMENASEPGNGMVPPP